MRRRLLCTCSSGKFEEYCCAQGLQVKVTPHSFKSEQDRQEIIRNLQISSQFEMRHRGIFLFYGKDFISYKLENPRGQERNEFLRLISRFMSFYLDDSCPTSWKNCTPMFWEEFITTVCPLHLCISPQQKQVEKFFYQLKKFVRWLDKREGTSWTPVILEFLKKYQDELKMCERLLNGLFLLQFPNIHKPDWDYQKDLNKLEEKYLSIQDPIESIFEIQSVIGNITIVTDLHDGRNYKVDGIPCSADMVGLLLNGAIGKFGGALLWNWYHTLGVYPQRSKIFLKMYDVWDVVAAPSEINK